MEAALIKLKQRNDELTAKTRDLTDGQPGTRTSTSSSVLNEQVEFEQIQDQVQQQAREHNERIVEMVSPELLVTLIFCTWSMAISIKLSILSICQSISKHVACLIFSSRSRISSRATKQRQQYQLVKVVPQMPIYNTT